MDTADANAATWADAAEAHPTATETHPATAEAHAAAAEAHAAAAEAHPAAAEVHPATPDVETTAAAMETAATAAVETATTTAVETAASAATRFCGQWRCKERRRHQQHCTNCNFAIFHGHLPAVMCTYAAWLSARRHTSCGAFHVRSTARRRRNDRECNDRWCLSGRDCSSPMLQTRDELCRNDGQ